MNLFHYCKHYLFPKTIFGIFAYLISYPRVSYIKAIFSAYLMALLYNVEHQVLHMFANLHLNMHHTKQIKLPRSVELLLEYIFEFCWFAGVPLLIQYVTGIWIIPPTIVLFLVFTLTNIHILWYSMIQSDTHSAHHKDTGKNFGPSFVDHLLGTNATEKYEDMNQFVPFVLMSALVLHFVKNYFQWKD